MTEEEVQKGDGLTGCEGGRGHKPRNAGCLQKLEKERRQKGCCPTNNTLVLALQAHFRLVALRTVRSVCVLPATRCVIVCYSSDGRHTEGALEMFRGHPSLASPLITLVSQPRVPSPPFPLPGSSVAHLFWSSLPKSPLLNTPPALDVNLLHSGAEIV